MYQPVIPLDGVAGWRFLQRTYDKQFAAFTDSVAVKNDVDYFRDNIGEISSAEDLVRDRRLLSVALGAFGLQDDIDNRFFIRKILGEGTKSDDALANRLADSRYREISRSFGFGPSETVDRKAPDFIEHVISRFEASSFEIAAGEQNSSMRIALYAERELGEIARMEGSNNAKWYTIMSAPPLRSLFEKALNLPKEFGRIDIDQQLAVFKDRAARTFGSDELLIFEDHDKVQDLITQFIARNQIGEMAAISSSGAIALTLLRG